MNEQMKQIFQALAQDPMGTIQALQQQGVDPKQILQAVQQAAQQGDQDAVEAMQSLQQAMSQGQQATPSAKNGAKLNYLRTLKNQCPEGEELHFFKAGGKVCSKCMKKASEGIKTEKVKKACKGGMTKAMSGIKAELAKCGGKAKRK